MVRPAAPAPAAPSPLQSSDGAGSKDWLMGPGHFQFYSFILTGGATKSQNPLGNSTLLLVVKAQK